MHLVLVFAGPSAWAHLRASSRLLKEGLSGSTMCLSQMAVSLGLPVKPREGLLHRLVAAERLCDPSFPLPEPSSRWQTLEGGGIWCVEYHPFSGLIFAGLWGPGHPDMPDHIKCWDAHTGEFCGSLYGHFFDVKCLRACGRLLYSGSYDGTARSWDVSSMTMHRIYVADSPVQAVEATNTRLFVGSENGCIKAWDTSDEWVDRPAAASRIFAASSSSSTASSSDLSSSSAGAAGLSTAPHDKEEFEKEKNKLAWTTSYSGPVTAFALIGAKHLIVATSCDCFNGSGYTLRVVDQTDGQSIRRLGDPDWSPRKNISFLYPSAQQDFLLAGFGAALGSVASGAVATEKEVARVLPLENGKAARKCWGQFIRQVMRDKRRQQQSEALSNDSSMNDFSACSSSSISSSSSSSNSRISNTTTFRGSTLHYEDNDDDDDDDFRMNSGTISFELSEYSDGTSVDAPAWGLESFTSYGGVVAAGTDNGLVVVYNSSGTHKHRIIDVCSAVNAKPGSCKVTAVSVAKGKLFVALQASAGDKNTVGLNGRLLEFNLLPDASNIPQGTPGVQMSTRTDV